jgi:thiol peroxidase
MTILSQERRVEMREREGMITFQGNPLTLVGNPVSVGMPAPGASLVTTDLKTTTLDDNRDKVLILAAVPSLDTSVCSEETKRFNREAEALPGDVKLVVVSMDLPFAQKRWADENHAANLTLLSDHKEAALGLGFGILIKELRLLARSVFVIDAEGKIAYMELVTEMTDEPDYAAAIAAAREALE